MAWHSISKTANKAFWSVARLSEKQRTVCASKKGSEKLETAKNGGTGFHVCPVRPFLFHPYDTEYGKEEINQDFDRCVFAKTWMDAGEEKYGRIYCENIDPAICKGYNEDLECIHDHIMYKDHHCTFCFRMKKKD